MCITLCLSQDVLQWKINIIMAYFNETEYKKISVDNLCEQYLYKPSHGHAVLQLYQVDS